MLAQQARSIRTDADTVMVNVRVTDERERIVVGLKMEDFKYTEDGVRQRIDYFGTETVPISLGIVFDVYEQEHGPGGRRSPQPIHNKTGLSGRLRPSGLLQPRGRFLFDAVRRSIELDVDFTQDRTVLQQMIRSYTASGMTRLWAAVGEGVRKAAQGKNARKAVVVVTDGDHDQADLSEKSLARFMREQYVQVYYMDSRLLGVNQRERNRLDAQRIAVALKSQYLIGYRSTNETPRKGKSA